MKTGLIYVTTRKQVGDVDHQSAGALRQFREFSRVKF
jgi:hypothetical protein